MEWLKPLCNGNYELRKAVLAFIFQNTATDWLRQSVGLRNINFMAFADE
ncbi:hypothetical protein [Nostoc sp. UHCC 0252]|nr:hypothetical protein [Nostoc sp. UHCC 0252]MEA5604716.1 hypothetical protein [Nostoc sp. UHCC 0252]